MNSIIERLRRGGYEKLHVSMRDGTFLDRRRQSSLSVSGGVKIIKSSHGYSGHFNGVDGILDASTTVLDGLTALTVSCWCKANRSGTIGPVGVNAVNSLFHFQIITGLVGLYTYTTGASGGVTGLTDLRTAHIGKWMHLCGVYDGANLRVYVDAVDDNPTPGVATGGLKPIGANTLQIGGSYTGRWWPGNINSVLIHNYALNATEVSQLYAETQPRG